MDYLSYSRLSLLETCGLRFYYEYILQLPPEDPVPTHHASFGRLLHALYEEHANSRGERSYEELKQLYDEGFPNIVPEFASREAAIDFYRQGLRAIMQFSRYLVNDVVASEKEFLIDVGSDTPPVKGFIDRVIDAPGFGLIVADLKTGKTFSGTDPKKMRQLVIYSIACQQVYGRTADSGYFDFVMRGKREWLDITEADRQAAKTWVRNKWQQIEQEQFSARYSPGFCTSYCPFRSRCPEFEKQQMSRAPLLRDAQPHMRAGLPG